MVSILVNIAFFSLRSFKQCLEFPAGPVVRILGFHHRGLSSVSDWGTVIHKPRGMAKKKKELNMLIVESEKFNTDDINYGM